MTRHRQYVFVRKPLRENLAELSVCPLCINWMRSSESQTISVQHQAAEVTAMMHRPHQIHWSVAVAA